MLISDKNVKHGNYLKVEMLVQNDVQKEQGKVKSGLWKNILANNYFKSIYGKYIFHCGTFDMYYFVLNAKTAFKYYV